MTLINNFDGLLNADNASGAPWFQVVKPADVATIPDVVLDQISTAITLNGGATAYNIMATVGTVQWSEVPQDVNGRLSYKSVFSFVIPKDRADVLNYAQHLNNRGVIAIVRDANGQNRLMGTIDEPATFKLSSRTLGNAEGQRNEHIYEISLVSPRPVPFYQVTDHLPAPVPPSGGGTCPSLAIEVFSDAGYSIPVTTVNYGATAYIKVTPTGITPTSYSFFFGNGTKNAPQVTQVGDSLAWVVSLTGTITISATATDGIDATADATPFTLTSTLVIANSLKFDGVNDYIFGCSSLGVGEDWSVSFSVKMLNTARDNAFMSLQGYREVRPSFLIGYEDSSQQLRFASWNSNWGAINSYTITPDTNWHKMAATYNYATTTLKVYYDNVLIYTNTSWTINNSLINVVYGFTDDWPFVGEKYGNIQVTDMRNHRATLTPTEVALVYANQLSGHELSLVPVTELVGQTTGYIDSIIGNSRMQLNNITSPFGIVLDAP